MLVAAGEHGRARRRADRRHVEAVVAKPLVRHAGVVRRVDRPAERARVAEAGVVDEDEQDVRGVLGRRHLRGLVPVRLRPFERLVRDAREGRAPNRENCPIDRRLTHHSTLRSLLRSALIAAGTTRHPSFRLVTRAFKARRPNHPDEPRPLVRIRAAPIELGRRGHRPSSRESTAPRGAGHDCGLWVARTIPRYGVYRRRATRLDVRLATLRGLPSIPHLQLGITGSGRRCRRGLLLGVQLFGLLGRHEPDRHEVERADEALRRPGSRRLARPRRGAAPPSGAR